MDLRRPRILPLLALGLLAASRVAALDKEAKTWLDEVGPIVLPEEEKVYKNLKDKSDLEEFRNIFWARRNPKGAAADQNPYRAEYETLKADVDEHFSVRGRKGSETDCGKVIILLGEPAEIRKGDRTEPAAAHFWKEGDRYRIGSVGYAGGEVWIFKGPRFRDGQAELPLDEECMGPAEFREQLTKVAGALVVNRNIEYKVGPGGHLTKLVDQLPKPTPTQALLKEPRQDFVSVADTPMILRGKEGGTYVGILVRGQAEGLATQDHEGAKVAPIMVGAQAIDEAGAVQSASEREVTAEVGDDGFFEVSAGLALKPGKYTIRAAAYDARSKKGSAVSFPMDVPDLGTGQLSVSPIMILPAVKENVQPNPKNPLEAFLLGTNQIVPRFKNSFTRDESFELMAIAYDGKLGPDGKAQLTARYTVVKDGKRVTGTDVLSFDTPDASPSAGPVPVKPFDPGKYVVQLTVNDKLSGVEVKREAEFEVK
jgi:GWxTD domain-containing protein